MKHLPFEDFYISSPFSPSEVQQRLEKEVEISEGFNFKNLFMRSSKFYFSGSVTNKRFELEPIVNYPNKSLPQITGKIESYLNGSRIHVKMRLTNAAFGFLLIWFGFVIYLAIYVSILLVRDGDFSIATFAPFAMILVGYALNIRPFKNESLSAKKKLVLIVEGEITENGNKISPSGLS